MNVRQTLVCFAAALRWRQNRLKPVLLFTVNSLCNCSIETKTMKYILFIIILAAANGLVAGQKNAKQSDAFEREIRRLEQGQVDALLRNDLTEMEKNWAEDYTVNNPFNEVIKASQGPIRTGTRTYSSFVRVVEKVLIHGKTVIVMGRETVVPNDTSPDAGKTIRRRFTNVWMKKKGKWKIIARHASIICQS